MYYLKTEQTFDSAHFLKGYDGKCSNLHGHCWRVVMWSAAGELEKEGQNRGMVMDFSDLKAALKQLCDFYDHCLICEKDSLLPSTMDAMREEGFRIVEVPFRPTAENISRCFFNSLKEQGIPVCRVEVYETEKNCAAYEE